MAGEGEVLWTKTMRDVVYEVRRGPAGRPYVVLRDGTEIAHVPAGSPAIDQRLDWDYDVKPTPGTMVRWELQNVVREICKRTYRYCEG